MPTHAYKNSAGEKVPGVTTVIGGNLGWKAPGLIHWAWKLGMEGKDYKAERQKAANAGTYAHALAEAHIRGQPAPPPPAEMEAADRDRAAAAYDAYLRWRDSSRIELRHSEVALVSECYQYGGCIDALGLLPGGRWVLVDFKASKATYADHLIQLAAYGILWNEVNPGCEIAEYHLLRFGPDGDFHQHVFSDLGAEWRAFQALLTLHQLKKGIEQKAK